MEVWKIKSLIRFCVMCAYFGFLIELKEDELICLLEECLALALLLNDSFIQRVIYTFLGALYEKLHQIGKAIDYYKKDLLIATETGDKSDEFSAYENLERAYRLLGNFQEAKKCHEKCLDIAKEMDKRGEAGAYQDLGHEFWSLGKYHEAIEYHVKRLNIGFEIGDKEIEGGAYIDLGNSYQALGEYQKAKEYFDKCLNIAMEIANKELEGMAFGSLGNIYEILGKYEKAQEFQEKCLAIAIDIGNRTMEGNVYGNLGNICYSLGKYPEAIKYLEERLSIAKEIGDRKGEECAYISLGNVCQSLGKYHEAIKYQEKCLAIALEIGDRKGEESSYVILGNACLALGQYQEAMKHHKKSLKIAVEIGDRNGEGSAYGNLGIVYQSLGKFDEAIEYNEKFRCIAVEIGDRRKEGKAYRNLGKDYCSLGKYQEAIAYHKKSLNIAVEIRDRNGEGIAYGNLGNAYHLLRKYYKAKDYYEKQLAIALNIEDRREEGNAYGNLGNVCCELGNYQKAIEYHKKRLAIALEISDESGEGATYTNLGNAYQQLGEYHEAKQCYEKQLSLAKKLGERAKVGVAYANIGNIDKLLGKYQTAIEYYQKSLTIAVEIGDKETEGAVYLMLGSAYNSKGNYYEAIKYEGKCLSIAKEIGDKKREEAANGCIGNSYQSMKKYQDAIEYYKNHLSIAEEIDDRDGQGNAHLNIGTCYRALAMQQNSNQPTNVKEAESHLKKSMKIYESIFDDLEQDQYKISIVDTFELAYRRLAEIYLETQQKDEALLVSERGRARALGDLLTLKYSLKKETTSKGRCPIEVADIEMLLSTCNFDILFYAIQRGDIAFQFLSWVLAHQSPLYLHRSGEIEGCKSSMKQSPMTEDNPEEIDKESIFNLVKKSYDKMKVREGRKCEDRSLGLPEDGGQDIEKEHVSSPVPGDQNTKTDARCIEDEDHDDDEKPMKLLYDALVAPVKHKFVQEEIVIIPDGPLNMVPFAAFQDPKTGQFLSETKRIRLAPSLTTLKVLQESSDDHHVKSGALIVGNPEIGKVKFEGIERSFTNLPGAEDEANEIAELLGVEPLIGKQATKEAVVQKLKDGVSVIHFAAHGSQENGQILLAPSASSAMNSIPDEQDYILTMKEAQESGIRAQLVVLSCCHSGRGEIKSEGVVGMSRAFLAAGARAVVASLWAIDDDATKVFMLKFYAHLKKEKSASKSLQQAMKDMRATERYSEPKYWAAFFLIGDDVTISV